MTGHKIIEILIDHIEEEFEEYEICIENNPDHYRGGYQWSVCKNDEMLDSGLAFCTESAISEAKDAIIALNGNDDYMLSTLNLFP